MTDEHRRRVRAGWFGGRAASFAHIWLAGISHVLQPVGFCAIVTASIDPLIGVTWPAAYSLAAASGAVRWTSSADPSSRDRTWPRNLLRADNGHKEVSLPEERMHGFPLYFPFARLRISA